MNYKIKIKNITDSVVLTRIPQDSHGFLSAKITENFQDRDFLFIAENDAEIEKIYSQISFFLNNNNSKQDIEIIKFYAWDCLPYDRSSPKSFILSNRIKCLYRLANRSDNKRFFVITSINSLFQKTICPSQIKNLALYLSVGDKISVEQISSFLVDRGYVRMNSANNVSEFAVRGGIVDIVVQEACDLSGYRIDFLGDEIESIKSFDPITQLSNEKVNHFEILPASEVIITKKTIENFRNQYRKNFGTSTQDQLYQAISDGRTYHGMEHWLPFFYEESLVSFFSYLENPLLFYDNKIKHLAEIRNKEIEEYYQARINDKKIDDAIYNPVKREDIYLDENDFLKAINTEENQINVEFMEFDFASNSKRILDLEIKPIPDFCLAGKANKKDPIELMINFIANFKEAKICFSCLSEGFIERVERTFLDYGIANKKIENFSNLTEINSNKMAIFLLPMKHGFYSQDLIIIGEQAVFGEKVIRKKSNHNSSQRLIEEGLTINLEELVVHRDHGIGKFQGIHTLEVLIDKQNKIKTDMIKILYAGGDTLFLPVDNIGLISRYGADNPLINLDRLGGALWKNRREKVKEKIRISAQELLKIAGERRLKKAPIFVPDQNFYAEFCARFNFVETQDQLKAIEEVENDLRSQIPMDRLICGDVGFGKTEVAMRAAAIVSSYAQVAIITPTTILSRQHYKNFSKRFEGSGIKIEQISRLITTTKAKQIRSEIESGDIKIIIGTHSLLQKNIKFFNLGLVIIDEEQHFGVAQKERFKEMKNEVHCLSLSATPIPRTLQMSLSNVKDLSLITTPPLDRIAVRNFIMPYDPVIVREAVMREYNRSGRIFFVVPRVSDIKEIEIGLKNLLPEIKINHAHGQMSAGEIEKIMNDFIDGKIDLLISTTIIESGIDISEANTMIIYKAELFGLAQLYQLRGRVGRGKIRAYCYFMTNNKKTISKDSQKKLEIMQNLDALGVGFSVASHDMDIRGSGNLLGDEQSGHVRETGVELYQQMLLETIQDLKNNQDLTKETNQIKINQDFTVSINLGISLLIPEEYMAELSLRMSFYKKISTIKNDEDGEILINEMNDRFGKIPNEVLNLIAIAKLKHACKNLDIEKMEINSEGIVVCFFNNKFKNPEKLLEIIFSSKDNIKIYNGSKVLFSSKILKEEKISSAWEVIKILNKAI